MQPGSLSVSPSAPALASAAHRPSNCRSQTRLQNTLASFAPWRVQIKPDHNAISDQVIRGARIINAELAPVYRKLGIDLDRIAVHVDRRRKCHSPPTAVQVPL